MNLSKKTLSPGIERLLYSKYSNVVISIILGLGLSCLFRKACDKRNCLVFKAPANFNDISKKTYKHNDKCYKFKPKSVTCDNSKQIVDFQ